MSTQNSIPETVTNGQMELPFADHPAAAREDNPAETNATNHVQAAAEPSANIRETNPTANSCMTHAQVAAIHLCPRCGQPAPAEFCRCGHRQCLTCAD